MDENPTEMAGDSNEIDPSEVIVPEEIESGDPVHVGGKPVAKKVIPAVVGSVFFLIWVFFHRSKRHRTS